MRLPTSLRIALIGGSLAILTGVVVVVWSVVSDSRSDSKPERIVLGDIALPSAITLSPSASAQLA